MKLNLSPTDTEFKRLVSRMVHSSLRVLAVETPDFRMSTFAKLNPSVRDIESVNSDAVVYKGRLELPRQTYEANKRNRTMPVYGGMVRGERNGSFWVNFAVDKNFKTQNRFGFSGLSFTAQVLMEAFPIGDIPRVLLFEEYMRERTRLLSAGSEIDKKFGLYCPFLSERFDSKQYVEKLRDSVDNDFLDDAISQVVKNYAYCLLNDLARPGLTNLSDEYADFFQKKYANLYRLSDYWAMDIGSTRSSYSTILTTNKLMESVKDAFYSYGINVGNAIKIPLSTSFISLNETDEEGKEFRDFSSVNIQSDLGSISDDDTMSAQVFMDNAILIAKDLLSAKFEKSVPTLFPGRKLPIPGSVLSNLGKDALPSDFLNATWIAYDKSINFSTGQYFVNSTRYKHADMLLRGSPKWMENRISRGIFVLGNENEVLGKVILNAEQIVLIRKFLNPVYSFEDKQYRYMGSVRSIDEKSKDKYAYKWLEVDKTGTPIAMYQFTRDKHNAIRDANPDLTGYNIRGVLSLEDDLLKASNKLRKYFPDLDNYLESFSKLSDKGSPEAIAAVSTSILRNFRDTLSTVANDEDAYKKGIGGILNRSFNDLIAPIMSQRPISEEDNKKIDKLDEDIERELSTNFSSTLYLQALAHKFAIITDVIEKDKDQQPASTKFENLSVKDKQLISAYKAKDPIAMEIFDSAKTLGLACESEFVAISPYNSLKLNLRSFETLQLRQYAPLRAFRKNINEFYGDDLFKDPLFPVVDYKRNKVMLGISDASKILTERAISGIQRELGVLTSIARGSVLSDTPVKVSSAAKVLPAKELIKHVNARVNMVKGSFDFAPNTYLSPYTPFTIFNDTAPFKNLCDNSQKAYLHDAVALHKFLSSQNLDQVKDIPKSSVSAIETTTLKEVHNVTFPKKSAEKLNSLIAGFNSSDPALKSVCSEALAAICLEAMGNSNHSKDIDILNQTIGTGESYAATAGFELAKELNVSGELLSTLESNGTITMLVKQLCNEIPNPEVKCPGSITQNTPDLDR